MRKICLLFAYISILSMAVLTACDDNLYYTFYQDLSGAKWDSNDAICFSIPPTGNDMDVTVTLCVRTTTLFQYKDIIARTEFLDGDSVVSSTPMNITLYNNQEGGASKGVLMVENYSKPQSLHMQAHHNYTLRVAHLMRLNPLDNVQSVGIIVEH